MQEILEALVGCHAHTRKCPAPEIAKVRAGTLLFHRVELRPAGITRGDQCAHTGAGDIFHRNPFLFEDAQYADMRNAAREASAEGHSDARASIARSIGEGPQAANGATNPLHSVSHGPEVPI